jgi:hypothetical protein
MGIRIYNPPLTGTAYNWRQSATGNEVPGESLAVAYGTDVVKGNLMIVVVGGGAASAGSFPIASISDTLSSSWNLIPNCPIESNPDVTTSNLAWMWWAIAPSSGANTVTVTMNQSTYYEMSIAEWYVYGAVPTLDAFGVAAHTTGTTLSVSSSSCLNPSDLLVAFVDVNAGDSTFALSGYTEREADTEGSTSLWDASSSVTGTQTANFTGLASGDAEAIIACFSGIPLPPSIIIC